MIRFEEMFIESDGKPIEYKGKLIMLWDEFILPKKKCKIKVTIISTDSEWKQGISIGYNGYALFEGERYKKGFSLWEDTMPNPIVFEVVTKDQILWVDNSWVQPGKQEWGVNIRDSITGRVAGAAMYYEELENGKRYYCNDGHFDEDFNDIIFEVQLVEEPS